MIDNRKINIDDMIKCVEREIGMRERVYPRWVEAKKMSAEKAESEIKTMKKVKDSLDALDECYEWLLGMIEVLNNTEAEHNRSLPVGNFEYAMTRLKARIEVIDR